MTGNDVSKEETNDRRDRKLNIVRIQDREHTHEQKHDRENRKNDAQDVHG